MRAFNSKYYKNSISGEDKRCHKCEAWRKIEETGMCTNMKIRRVTHGDSWCYYFKRSEEK